jgi:Ca-activated chloride channel family protein
VPFPSGDEDLFGNPTWQYKEIPVNPELLKKIAEQTGGEFYQATDREELRGGLQKVLDTMERSKLLEGGAAANYDERYFPFLLWAFVLVSLEVILRSTVLRVSP